MSWTVIAHSKDCQDGKCPTIWRDDETGRVRVRGYTRGWLRFFKRETDVEYSAEEFAHLTAQLEK